ncbi:MAG: peptide ABC transporter permease [Zestosphaera tikiterensis]|uniref:Peptide ABC transporter permease n=1 Tax=Zestosphaera tikiterensis TaxID=1973259 RepID=A0A2R7Y7I7_9CREN|nr:MAG: peptide ABC transporter permease [Zestosphaera tikiterensis]
MTFFKFLIYRIVGIFVTVVTIIAFLFLLLRSIPGDPARLLAGFDATPEVIEQIRMKYGLNKPLHEQLITYFLNVIRLDLGISIRTDTPVVSEVLSRLPNTLTLSFASLAIAVTIGLPLGAIAAVKKDSFVDLIATALVTLGTAIPTFWLGLMLILFFSVYLRVLPAGGTGTPTHIVLPAVTLSLPVMAPIIKTSRYATLEILSQDFVKLAKAKGLSNGVVLFKHVLRNTLIPVVTVVGLQLGNLMRGAVITETVFAWPGVGKLVVDAIFARDYPMVQGAIFILALLYASINFLVDLTYVVIDPRTRVGGGQS